jgi:hypothetical protein|eukprot:COSAG01_NODE_1893_length_8976_cov_21.264053_5_plen_140_part_00
MAWQLSFLPDSLSRVEFSRKFRGFGASGLQEAWALYLRRKQLAAKAAAVAVVAAAVAEEKEEAAQEGEEEQVVAVVAAASETEQEQEIQYIMAKGLTKGGEVIYQVRWRGCKQDTWVLHTHCSKALIAEFEAVAIVEPE